MWDPTNVAWRGTQYELYQAATSVRYHNIIGWYYKWKRGLYTLPPFPEAPYVITETFNIFDAYAPAG